MMRSKANWEHVDYFWDFNGSFLPHPSPGFYNAAQLELVYSSSGASCYSSKIFKDFIFHALWFMIFNVSLLCFIMFCSRPFLTSPYIYVDALTLYVCHHKMKISAIHSSFSPSSLFSPGEMTSDFFRVVNEARSHSLGPFSPSFDIQSCILEGMRKGMPEDAHIRVNGKLHISLTRVYDGKSIIVSQFNSKDDLMQALLCACFIPGKMFEIQIKSSY